MMLFNRLYESRPNITLFSSFHEPHPNTTLFNRLYESRPNIMLFSSLHESHPNTMLFNRLHDVIQQAL